MKQQAHPLMQACLLSASALCMMNASAQSADYVSIERGRYLAAAGDCISCHTVKGGKPFAGGYPVETPFGTIYSSNLTPDVVTGLGNWSSDDFYRALHEGKRKDGQFIYPACPYPWFTRMPREDVNHLWAYLSTLEPVRAIKPDNDLIWPLGWRQMVGGWNLLFFDEGEYTPDPDQSDVWNRGAYLVNGPAHCAACHSPKNVFGATEGGQAFEGGEAGESWYAPGLTDRIPDGLGQWTHEDIVQYLKTGANWNTASSGPMTEVVMNSTQHLTDDDLMAVATYLKTLDPAEKKVGDEVAATDEVMVRGQALYLDQCMGCHMADGQGQEDAFPALAGSSSVQSKRPDSLIQVVLGGDFMADPPARPTGLGMPAFDWKLDDRDVADVLTYVRNSWGNQAPPVSVDQVDTVRQDLHEYGPRYRRLLTQARH